MMNLPRLTASTGLMSTYAKLCANNDHLSPAQLRAIKYSTEDLVKRSGRLLKEAEGLSSKGDAEHAGLVRGLRTINQESAAILEGVAHLGRKDTLDARLLSGRFQALSNALESVDEIRLSSAANRSAQSLEKNTGIAREADVIKLTAEERRYVDLDPKLARIVSRTGNSKLTRLLTRTHVVGGDNVPKSGGFVLATTHTGQADMLHTAMGHNRVLRSMAHSDQFSYSPRFTKIAESIGAYPVTPGDSGSGMRITDTLLSEGQVVKIYPEGFVPRVNHLADAREGAAIAAIRAKKPVVVQGEWGTRPAREYGESKLKHWSHLGGRGAVAYSKPIETSHLDANNRAHVLALTNRIGEEMTLLREQARVSLEQRAAKRARSLKIGVAASGLGANAAGGVAATKRANQS